MQEARQTQPQNEPPPEQCARMTKGFGEGGGIGAIVQESGPHRYHRTVLAAHGFENGIDLANREARYLLTGAG
jgi:hypothetical protein